MTAVATTPTVITLPELREGEIYAGLIVQKGAPVHHLVLLAGELKSATHKAATKWAEELGGALPTRAEQAVLFGNAKEEFKPDWYWSGEQYAGAESYAWYQSFLNGNQHYYHKSIKLRARAVRRVSI